MAKLIQANPAGRAFLVVTALVCLTGGMICGYIITGESLSESKVSKDVLSDDVFMIGTGDSPSLGPEHPLVTIVEYNKIRCEPCSFADAILRQAIDIFPGEVAVVWKSFVGEDAGEEDKMIAEAGVMANAENKFWEFKDALESYSGKINIESLTRIAEAVDMDADKFKAYLQNHHYLQRLKVDINTANRIGVTSAPTIFINGRLFKAPLTLQNIIKAVKIEKKNAMEMLKSGVERSQLYWEIIKSGKFKVKSTESEVKKVNSLIQER